MMYGLILHYQTQEQARNVGTKKTPHSSCCQVIHSAHSIKPRQEKNLFVSFFLSQFRKMKRTEIFLRCLNLVALTGYILNVVGLFCIWYDGKV